MKRWIAVAGVLALTAAACRERGRPDPNIRMAVSHEPSDGGQAQGGEGAPSIPTRLEVPPEVQSAYSGVRLRWKDRQSGKEGVVEVPLGATVPLPDPSLVVRGDVYLPSFTMGGGAITSDGVEEKNPAARITVAEKGKEIFGGWIFTRFPDVHPFSHARYELRLEGGVRSGSK
jgi:Uncharacterized protein conserved in bacteria (DUF2155)